MAKITIGGKEYNTQPLRFKQLKKAFPLIKENQQVYKEAADRDEEVDPIDGMARAIAIVAIALERTNPELTPEKIEEEIFLGECRDLQDAIVQIITESGFEVATPGEGEAAEGAASPSTETSTS